MGVFTQISACYVGGWLLRLEGMHPVADTAKLHSVSATTYIV